MLLKTGGVGDLFDGNEEFFGGFLLLNSLGKVSDGSTGFVHVTGKFVVDVEPLLLGDVLRDQTQTNFGFGKDGLLAVDVFRGTILVKGVSSGFGVNRVRRVDGLALVGSVSGTFRVRSTVSDQTENRESRRFTSGGVGGSGGKSGTSGGNSGEGFTTGSLLSQHKTSV